ncbi:MAG: MBL fold metallo-hydrolase [Armatimonadetes bacterium]|nr:MBL fold metallo-hydrolase [Armatimonadota bacterium]
MRPICVASRFHPVGQGLFYSAHFCSGTDRRFTYVFDCGTLSKQAWLAREIKGLGVPLNGDRIDLLCISHFDRDHVSGVRRILADHGTRVIVMPYMSLAERLALAVEDDAADDYLEFLIDPAGALVGAEGDSTQVIFIAAGPDPSDPPSTDRDDPDRHSNEGDNYSFEPDLPEGDPSSEADSPLSSPQLKGRIRICTHDQPINLRGLWEFVFYNENRPDVNLTHLEKQILALIAKHKDARGKFQSADFLPQVRKLYESTFGTGGRNANRISLVLFSGPQGRRQLDWRRHHPFEIECYWCLAERLHCLHPDDQVHARGHLIAGSLLTGDIFFDKPGAVLAAQRHFTRRRWNRIETLQVPHHGSSHSWHSGAADLFSHSVSVVSAASTNRKHPGKLVIEDLDATWLVRVDEHRGHSTFGWI